MPPKSPGGGLILAIYEFFVPLWGVWGAVFDMKYFMLFQTDKRIISINNKKSYLATKNIYPVDTLSSQQNISGSTKPYDRQPERLLPSKRTVSDGFLRR